MPHVHSTGSHKDSVSMESRDGVEERDTVLVRGFYTAGTKTTPSFRDGIGASGSRNGTLDPESCYYGSECEVSFSCRSMVFFGCLLFSLSYSLIGLSI